MASFDDILNLITQLRLLVEDTKSATGLPPAGVPKGVNPAPQGSTFDKKSIPSVLSTSEKHRIKQVADIFRDRLFPKDEASKAHKMGSSINKFKEEPVEAISRVSQPTKKGGGILEVISGLLGIGGGVAGGGAALPILAGFVGAGLLAIGGATAARILVEALKAAKDVDWEKLSGFGDIIIKGMGAFVDVFERLTGVGLDVIKAFADIWRENINAVAETINMLGGGMNIAIDVFARIVDIGLYTIKELVGIGNESIRKAIDTLRYGISTLSDGLSQMFNTIKMFDHLDFVTFAAAFATGISTLVLLGAAGTMAPIIALGAVVAQIGGWGLEGLSAGISAFGISLGPLADGISKLESLDGNKLRIVGSGLGALSDVLLRYAGSSLITVIAGNLANLFGGSGISDLLRFSMHHRELGLAATNVDRLAKGFKQWTDVRTDHLAWNLKEIADSLDRMDIRKMDKLSQSKIYRSSNTVVIESLHRYLVTGKTSGANDTGGLINLTKDILLTNREQLKELQSIKTVIMKCKRPEPPPGRFTTTTSPGIDVRSDLFPELIPRI
jgi:hypothetical protein